MRLCLIIISMLISNLVSSQELPQEIWDQVELFLEDREDGVDLSVLFDRYKIYYENPQDINHLSYDDLQDLGLLSDIQIIDLLAHKQKYGNLIMIEELQSIPSFQTTDIQRLRPFLQVSDPNKLPVSLKSMLKESRHEVFLKWGRVIEQRAGFEGDEQSPPDFLGDPNRWTLRYRGNFENKLRFGLISEKDEGEQLLSDTINSGLDFVTAHFHLRDYNSLLKDVVIGDYSISFGQGLIAHNGFRAGKSAFVTQVKKGGRVLRPYTSITENGFHRGAAVTLALSPKIEVTSFFSRVNRDGNVRVDSIDFDTPDLFLSSLQTTGMHRTVNEKEDKGTLGLTSIGGSIKYFKSSFDISINHLSNLFDTPLIREDNIANRFRFSGNQLHNTSIDYSYRYRNIHLYGESAYSSTGGFAHLAGALIGLDKRLSASLVYRNYGTSYNSIAPNAFGESSLVNNESGLYLGLELQLSRRWLIRTYADVWRHPWIRTSVNNPSDGKEYLLRLDYSIRRKLNVYLQFFHEEKLENLSLSDELISAIGDSRITVGRLHKRQRLRLHFSHQLNKFLELRNRIELSRAENINGVTNGVLLFQDVLYKPWAKPYSITGRIAFFDIDDFRSRIFAYENNILYEFGIPSFSGRGIRYYVNFRYKITRNLLSEFRWARTIKDRGTHGSGTSFIDGDTRTDLRFQLRYSF